MSLTCQVHSPLTESTDRSRTDAALRSAAVSAMLDRKKQDDDDR